MSSISQHNNKQDKEIAKLKQRLDDWFFIWDKFLENDFYHLRRLVLWLVGLSIAGLLVPIFIRVFF